MKSLNLLLVLTLFCNVNLFGQSNDCIEILKLGIYDYFYEHSKFNLDQLNISEEARKYEMIRDNWSKDDAEAHYYAIGGSRSFSEEEYLKLGESLYLLSLQSLIISEENEKRVRKINPKILDTFIECKKINDTGLKYSVSSIQDSNKIIISLENDTNKNIILKGISADGFKCEGELWKKHISISESDKIITPYIENISLIAERITNYDVNPCGLIADRADIIIITDKSNLVIPFPRIRKECPKACRIKLNELTELNNGFLLEQYSNKNINITCSEAIGALNVRIILKLDCLVEPSGYRYGARTMRLKAKINDIQIGESVWKQSGNDIREFSTSFSGVTSLDQFGNLLITISSGEFVWGQKSGNVSIHKLKIKPTSSIEIIPIDMHE